MNLIWEWEGGYVYGDNLGGGSEPALATVSLDGRIVTNVLVRWSYPHDFALLLGPYPHERYIDLPARKRETAERLATPYVVGYILGCRVKDAS